MINYLQNCYNNLTKTNEYSKLNVTFGTKNDDTIYNRKDNFNDFLNSYKKNHTNKTPKVTFTISSDENIKTIYNAINEIKKAFENLQEISLNFENIPQDLMSYITELFKNIRQPSDNSNRLNWIKIIIKEEVQKSIFIKYYEIPCNIGIDSKIPLTVEFGKENDFKRQLHINNIYIEKNNNAIRIGNKSNQHIPKKHAIHAEPIQINKLSIVNQWIFKPNLDIIAQINAGLRRKDIDKFQIYAYEDFQINYNTLPSDKDILIKTETTEIEISKPNNDNMVTICIPNHQYLIDKTKLSKISIISIMRHALLHEPGLNIDFKNLPKGLYDQISIRENNIYINIPSEQKASAEIKEVINQHKGYIIFTIHSNLLENINYINDTFSGNEKIIKIDSNMKEDLDCSKLSTNTTINTLNNDGQITIVNLKELINKLTIINDKKEQVTFEKRNKYIKISFKNNHLYNMPEDFLTYNLLPDLVDTLTTTNLNDYTFIKTIQKELLTNTEYIIKDILIDNELSDRYNCWLGDEENMLNQLKNITIRIKDVDIDYFTQIGLMSTYTDNKIQYYKDCINSENLNNITIIIEYNEYTEDFNYNELRKFFSGKNIEIIHIIKPKNNISINYKNLQYRTIIKQTNKIDLQINNMEKNIEYQTLEIFKIDESFLKFSVNNDELVVSNQNNSFKKNIELCNFKLNTDDLQLEKIEELVEKHEQEEKKIPPKHEQEEKEQKLEKVEPKKQEGNIKEEQKMKEIEPENKQGNIKEEQKLKEIELKKQEGNIEKEQKLEKIEEGNIEEFVDIPYEKTDEVESLKLSNKEKEQKMKGIEPKKQDGNIEKFLDIPYEEPDEVESLKLSNKAQNKTTTISTKGIKNQMIREESEEQNKTTTISTKRIKNQMIREEPEELEKESDSEYYSHTNEFEESEGKKSQKNKIKKTNDMSFSNIHLLIILTITTLLAYILHRKKEKIKSFFNSKYNEQKTNKNEEDDDETHAQL